MLERACTMRMKIIYYNIRDEGPVGWVAVKNNKINHNLETIKG